MVSASKSVWYGNLNVTHASPTFKQHSVQINFLYYVGQDLHPAIIKRFYQGESAYAIALSIGESLASIVHLRSCFQATAISVETLTLEQGLLETLPQRPVPNDCINRLKLTSLWPTWSEFTYSFSRYIYPKRFPFWRPPINLTG